MEHNTARSSWQGSPCCQRCQSGLARANVIWARSRTTRLLVVKYLAASSVVPQVHETDRITEALLLHVEILLGETVGVLDVGGAPAPVEGLSRIRVLDPIVAFARGQAVAAARASDRVQGACARDGVHDRPLAPVCQQKQKTQKIKTMPEVKKKTPIFSNNNFINLV